MMPVVRLNDATFADLSTLRTWLGTKTPSETIDIIVREALSNLDIEGEGFDYDTASEQDEDVMRFESSPGLTFTKPLVANVRGTSIHNPKWSSILIALVTELHSDGLRGDKLVEELNVPSKSHKYESEGFKFYSKLGISIQGQSSEDAWKEIERLSKKWQVPVSVEFMWRYNPKARYPGKRGIIQAS
ncbi:T4SS efffector SepA family protein [Arenibacterium halophilum]|uniref:Uncharacterized protein n=1 Tax=Arenibacterium halophilum TaxID=2583821 RepID=A0ABY2X4V8_9RHOB|nr:hypothetical protein [Arenibacterium halophilum]TMV10488.1 hypothetical protein FGK64_17040 [Arenibacterium halophilum]